MPTIITDIIVDLSYGDCGKGKVTHSLLRENHYTHVLRYNGGCNAGHTIFHDNKKYITHHIPAGVFYPNVKSIIGPGCVVNVEQFLKEIKELKSHGFDTTRVHVAENTHIITSLHMTEDGAESKLGTTKRGNGPAYSDKYSRTGIRAEEVDKLKPFTINLYSELHNNRDVHLLCEGAQGFGLDIDWGDYPYVTSSHCTTAGALLNGIPWQSIRHVYGVIKAYETYVGAKDFDSGDPVNDKIRTHGEEYGATTGRSRQINWLDLDLVEKAAKINGITHLIINKMDILDKISCWKLFSEGELRTFPNEEEMKEYIVTREIFLTKEVRFSYSPLSI